MNSLTYAPPARVGTALFLLALSSASYAITTRALSYALHGPR